MKKTAFIFIALPALLFLPAVIFNHMPFFMDIAAYFYPLRCAAARQIAQGRLPLWASSVCAGMPLLANPQIAALYPPNWLFFALPRGGMFTALFMLHVYLLGLGTFFWLRARRFPADAALGAALLVQASGATWAHVAFGSYLFAMGLAPWLFFMQEQLWRTRRAIYFSGMAVVAALLILCGAIQAAYYAFLLLILSSLLRMIETRFSRRALFMLPSAIAAIALGAGLAAVQLLPTREFVAQTARAGNLPMSAIKVGSLTFRRLLEAHLGCGTFPQDTGDAAYIGAAGLFLILWGALASGRRRRISDIIFWLGFLSLGVWRLSGIYARLLPGFGGFHDPRRILALAPLAAAPLLARGFLSLRLKSNFPMPARLLFLFLAVFTVFFLWAGKEEPTRQLWRALGFIPNLSFGNSVILSACLLGALFILTFLLQKKRRIFFAGLLCLSIFEILNYSFCRIDTKFAPEASFRPRTLMPQSKIPPDLPQSPVRIFSYDASMNYSYDYIRAADSRMPNIAALEGVSDFQGYEPLRSIRYTRFLSIVNQPQRLLYGAHFGILRQIHSPLIERMGITHAFGKIPLPENSAPSTLPGKWAEIGEGVYEYIPRPARFVFVPCPLLVDTPDQAAEALLLETRIGEISVVIESSGEKQARAFPKNEPSTASIRIRTLAEGWADVDVAASSGGYLVFREGWAPGWRVHVDNRPASNLCADLMFQSVRIEKGAHRVEWRYRPASFFIGIIISFISIIIAAMLPFYLRRKHEIPQNKFQR